MAALTRGESSRYNGGWTGASRVMAALRVWHAAAAAAAATADQAIVVTAAITVTKEA